MKVASPRSISQARRSTSLQRKATANTAVPAKPAPAARVANTSRTEQQDTKSLDDGLAICLFGFGYQKSKSMYDNEYEEEVRKQAVMSEVLPDAAMWKKWEETEAPLRQGRGWFPRLDRHFLELLVISEIHCLAHPLHGTASAPGQAERIHRHASRVRRVACDRIGSERLHAYCDRVKEAFEAYMNRGWGGSDLQNHYEVSEASDESPTEDKVMGEAGDAGEADEADEQRGRTLERSGSAVRADGREDGPVDVNEVKEGDPFGDENTEEDGPADMLKIELDDVDESEEQDAMDIEFEIKLESRRGALSLPLPAVLERPSGIPGGLNESIDKIVV